MGCPRADKSGSSRRRNRGCFSRGVEELYGTGELSLEIAGCGYGIGREGDAVGRSAHPVETNSFLSQFQEFGHCAEGGTCKKERRAIDWAMGGNWVDLEEGKSVGSKGESDRARERIQPCMEAGSRERGGRVSTACVVGSWLSRGR